MHTTPESNHSGRLVSVLGIAVAVLCAAVAAFVGGTTGMLLLMLGLIPLFFVVPAFRRRV